MHLYGRCYTLRREGIVSVHIYYLKHFNDDANILIRAHEETHVLQKFNKISLIKERLEKDNIYVSLEQLEGEIGANIGGIHALVKRNINPKEVRKNLLPKGYDEAISAYNSSYSS